MGGEKPALGARVDFACDEQRGVPEVLNGGGVLLKEPDGHPFCALGSDAGEAFQLEDEGLDRLRIIEFHVRCIEGLGRDRFRRGDAFPADRYLLREGTAPVR